MIKNNILKIISVGIMLVACNDNYLDLEPTTQISESSEFWNSESSLVTFSNGFYNHIDRNQITADFSSDNCEHIGNPPSIRRGIYSIPTALGSGGWSWTYLRDINYFIENVTLASVDANVKIEYLALAKFFRAWFYFDKVKQFGDVPWYSKALKTNDDNLLFKSRDSRVLVMDSVLQDINYAIKYLPDYKSKNRINSWTALALKSRICLYEGTWRNYHTESLLENGNDFLNEAVEASKQIMDAGVFSLYTSGDINSDYFQLFQPKNAYTQEVILARSTDNQNFYYTPLFTSTSNGNYGATRSLISNYLMSNGQRFYEVYPTQSERDTMSYFDEFQNRDPRLRQSIVYPGYIRVGTSEVTVTDFAQNATGYMVHKRVGPPIEDQGGGTRDVIIFRYAEVLLNYAEAKAELGILTQQDLDQSINVIRSRVGIPPLSVGISLDNMLDEYYQNTSNPLVLEVRRERRVELAFEGFRKDDLIRWKEADLFRAQYEGIYVTALHKYIDLDNDGENDLYVFLDGEFPPLDQNPSVQYLKLSNVAGLTDEVKGRIVPFDRPLPSFEIGEYLNPIPTEELTLNPQLQQNPGW